jgi:enoyl-CoA hydratase/carnithine racemase
MFKIFKKSSKIISYRLYSTTGASNFNKELVLIDDNYENNFMRRILMNNEKQRNALSLNMIRELAKAIDSTDLNKCRVLVLGSTSSTIFSSGHNLKEFIYEDNYDVKYHENLFNECTDLCLKLKKLSIPTIAQVSGLAAAAGFQLALSCDLIVATDKSSFSTPGVKFGLFCSTPGVALSRNVSSKIGLKMLLTGEPIHANEALQHGIISEIVNVEQDPDALSKRVNHLANLIRANSRPVIEMGKKCFYQQIEFNNNLEKAYDTAGKTMVDNIKLKDTQLGMKAFKSKSKPIWTHSNDKLVE